MEVLLLTVVFMEEVPISPLDHEADKMLSGPSSFDQTLDRVWSVTLSL